MFHIPNRIKKWLWFAILFCVVLITLQFPKLMVSAQTGVTLIPIPIEALSTDFQWSADSSSLIFNSVGGQSHKDKVRVIYDVNTQITSQTLISKVPKPVSALNLAEISQLSPFISPDTNQPIVVLSPNRKYAVYLSSDWTLDVSGTVKMYRVYLTDRVTKQKIDTTLLVLNPVKSFDVIWNRTSTAFVIMNEVYEIGTRTFAGYVSDFDQLLANLRVVSTEQDILLINGQTYVPGGLFSPNSSLPDLVLYGIPDDTTPRRILTSLSCGSSVIVLKQPSCATQIHLAIYNFDNPNQSQVFTQINGDQMVSASFSAGSDQVLWAITDQGLVQFDTRSGNLTVIDARLSVNWAYFASFSPDRKWLAVMNTDSVNQIYVVKLPIVAL